MGELQGLKRSLGLWPCIAAAMGLVVASTTLVSLGQGFGIAGPGFIIPMVIAMILNLFVAFSFAELSSIIPKAGGINHYTLPALGPFAGLMSVVAGYVLVNIFAGSAESTIPGLVFSEVFAPSVNPKLFSIGMIIVLMLVNIRGIDFFAYLQMFLTTLMMGTLLVIGIIGLTGMGAGEPVATSFDTFNMMGLSVLSLTALAFWLFLGLEFVTPLAEEIRKPKIYIPIAMFSALLLIFITKVIYGLASIKYVPLDVLASSTAPHVEAGMAIASRTGQVWMAIATILAALSTVNTLTAAIPRMIYGLAQEGQAPRILGTLSRWQTPWVAIVFASALFMAPIIIGLATIEIIVVFILAGVFCYFITYIIAHLNVIILRYKYPHTKRAFKSPFWILPQLIGIGGMIYMMLNIFPEPEIKRMIYQYAIIFLVVSAAGSALWVKLVMKKGLFEVTPLEEIIGAEAFAEAGSKEIAG
ncbi:MAG: APC family permease [Bacillota bacterium]